MKGSKITPEDAAKNPQAVLEALEFYTEQTRREKSQYDTKPDPSPQQQKKQPSTDSNPKPSRSTPAPRHIREPPPKPTQFEPPSLPKADLDLVKGMDKDVQIMMEKLKIQQVNKEVVEL